MTAWRTIGVLGGMGPAATVDFLGKLVAAAGATRDQEHPRVLVDSDPTLPDRHLAIRREGPSPGPRLAAMARGLLDAGAEVMCMPCNTAHAFEAEVRSATDVPFVSIVQTTANATVAAAPGAKRIGLLAAEGCQAAGLYPRAFAALNIETIDAPLARLMPLIWRIKAGGLDAGLRADMLTLAMSLVDQGAQVIVAACTEVPLALIAADLPVPLIDSSEALAQGVIAAARR